MSSLESNPATHRTQYFLQLVQVSFVGLTLGMTRTVVPAVAEVEFGVPRGDLALVATFVIAFGIVKGAMNLIAGVMSESIGRKRVLILGWLIALPIPWMIWFAPAPPRSGGWLWIVAATVLLGANQGLTWSMTITSKLDLARPDRRGLTNGLNEFCGYFAVAIAGIITAYLSDRYGARQGLLVFGVAAILPALIMAITMVRETRPSAAKSVQTGRRSSSDLASDQNAPVQSRTPTSREVFAMSFRNRTFFALCQCGLVEKFIDCLMWIALPLLLIQRGVDLKYIGWIPGIYAATWGSAQIVTGPMSDRLGRKPLIVVGMLMCAASVVILAMSKSITGWSVCSAATGLGMAMLYPTLGAAVSDFALPQWRATALGVYRFWRDLGYAFGAAALAALSLAGFNIASAFGVIAAIVAASGIVAGWLYRTNSSAEL